MARLQGEKGTGGASFGGKFYQADKNGIIEVPSEAVGDLVGHGWSTDIVEGAQVVDLKELGKAVGDAKKALGKDPENPELKAALDQAVAALNEAKKA